MLEAIVVALCTKTPDPVVKFDMPNGEAYIEVGALDYGKIAGKSGLHIWAISTLMTYAGLAQVARAITTHLEQPKDHPQRNNLPFEPKDDWNREQVGQLVETILETCLKLNGRVERIDETAKSEATIYVQIEKYLQTGLSDPSFEKAFRTVVRAAGKSLGVVLETEISWR